jgi:abequosyltransferase
MDALLTIAVPTYNRAALLDQCLSSISDQWSACGEAVEIIVSDNASPDRTRDVVDAHITNGMKIQYILNETNIGASRNVVQCYQRASGNYVWIIGDDDVLLGGALEQILPLLKTGECGVINLNMYGFKENHPGALPARMKPHVVAYGSPAGFFARANFWVTLLSANIVRKTPVDPGLFADSNLPHVYWIVAAALAAKKNCRIENCLAAFRAGNTGGYNIYTVFGSNLDAILNHFTEREGADPRLFSGIRKALLLGFFPSFIVKIRAKALSFDDVNPLAVLGPIYRSYPLYWIAVVPSARLPLPLAVFWGKAMTFLSVMRQKVLR